MNRDQMNRTVTKFKTLIKIAHSIMIIVLTSTACISRNIPVVLTPTPSLSIIGTTPTFTATFSPTHTPTSTPTANPRVLSAISFAKPFQDYISHKAPTFEDDFSHSKKGWLISYPNQKNPFTNDLFAINLGQLCLYPDAQTPLIHVINPKAHSTNFAVSVTVSTESSADASAQIGWDAQTFVLWVNSNTWETRSCGADGCEPNHDAGWNQRIQPSFPLNMMIIASGPSFALYLDGEPLTYVDDPIHYGRDPSPSVTLMAFSSMPTRVCYDDFKFWNLDAATQKAIK